MYCQHVGMNIIILQIEIFGGFQIENFLNNLEDYQKNLDKVEPWDNTEILKDLDLSIEKYSRLYNQS